MESLTWDFKCLKISKGEVQFKAYLKDFFIKYPGSKHYNSFGINDGVGVPEQLLRGLLFTVQNEGDGLLVHTDGHSMPPGTGGELYPQGYWVSCSTTTRYRLRVLSGSDLSHSGSWTLFKLWAAVKYTEGGKKITHEYRYINSLDCSKCYSDESFWAGNNVCVPNTLINDLSMEK